MRTQPIASFLFLAAILVPACSDDGETCSDGDCTSGPGGSGSGPATSTSSSTDSTSTGQGGSGGGGLPLSTDVVFTDLVTGEPLPHEVVVVNAADGSVVLQTLTGTDGSVPVEIPAGGSVTVFYSFSLWAGGAEYPLRRAQTVFPGDAQPVRIALQDGGFYEAEPGPGLMLVGVTWDVAPGAGEYLAKSNCFAESEAPPSQAAAAYMTDCTNDGLYDVVIAAYDQFGALDRFAVLADQPFIDQWKLNHQIPWTNGGGGLGDIPYSITNLKDSTTFVDVSSVATRRTHGAPITLEQLIENNLPDETELSGTIRHAVGFGDDHCTTIRVALPLEVVSSYSRCGSTANLLPIMFDASRLAQFKISGPTPTSAAWEEAVAGELGDLMAVHIWQTGDGTDDNISWTAYVAPGAGSVTRPDLPAGLENYAVPRVDYASVVNQDLHDAVGFAEALEEGPSSRNGESVYDTD
ncbi:MAG: hypothetical protein HOV80_01385 [Polyangiaceae bacterium]|nr:hypothetical protein [Polyangiaceae bacterium]